MELGVFVIGRNSIWQKVGFIQVFYNELTLTVYLGHADTSSTRFPLIFAEKKRMKGDEIINRVKYSNRDC